MIPTKANAVPFILLILPTSIRAAAKSDMAPATPPRLIRYIDDPNQKEMKNATLRNILCRVSEYARAMVRGMHGVKPIRTPKVKVEYREPQYLQTLEVKLDLNVRP
jgi:hypothetical protein